MDAADLEYLLPTDRIAQAPIEPRDAARLLVDRGTDRPPGHHRVADLPGLLHPGDLLVVNDTRVRAARLRLTKPTGGAAEVLLLEPVADGWWDALVRPSRRIAAGTVLVGGDLRVEVGEVLDAGRRRVRVLAGDPEVSGELPLPPYIRAAPSDPERYQTVYARRAASAAAPTAGLHLSQAVLEGCAARGIGLAPVELVVGVDTFRPITEERVEDHPMHTEAYAVPAATLDAIAATRSAGGSVIAVGTTVVRVLESVAASGERVGRTALFIRPGHRFTTVDRLLTNFHVPRSTLLALVAAFVGPRWRDLYEIALEYDPAREDRPAGEALAGAADHEQENYRFLSFGDAMLLHRAAA